ncbi:crinkler family protein [Gigaspora margarita]|uniref:Crinkler family protein n=1 Tax=Gigaspora margarita TaxID=4874 RepID=A0A8H4EPM9_GIGMA|nr:crinkler family protein [Gigaspora margarita]
MLHMPLDLLITNTLELFKESVGIPLSIDRNKSDSGYTAKGYFRPDFVCKIKEALIFKGEEKASHVSIKTAEKELKEKFNRIDPQVFGNINFFLCYAAAGSRLRFYTIDGSKNSSNCLVPLSNEIDIVDIYDRFEVIKIIINIARIVKSIIPSLP